MSDDQLPEPVWLVGHASDDVGATEGSDNYDESAYGLGGIGRY